MDAAARRLNDASTTLTSKVLERICPWLRYSDELILLAQFHRMCRDCTLQRPEGIGDFFDRVGIGIASAIDDDGDTDRLVD